MDKGHQQGAMGNGQGASARGNGQGAMGNEQWMSNGQWARGNRPEEWTSYGHCVKARVGSVWMRALRSNDARTERGKGIEQGDKVQPVEAHRTWQMR